MARGARHRATAPCMGDCPRSQAGLWGEAERSGEWVSGCRAASALPGCCLHHSTGPEGASPREAPAQKQRRERLRDQRGPAILGSELLPATAGWRKGDLETAFPGKDEN